MFSSFYINPRSNPELISLYEISHLPPSDNLSKYFLEVMAVLSKYFPVNFAALILPTPQNDFLSVEAIYGIGKETQPFICHSRKGLIDKVLQSRHPLVIQNLTGEPFYEELMQSQKWVKNIQPPLLCVPLLFDGESIGVINITPPYGARNDFVEDIHYLSVLSTLLSPVIKKYYTEGKESLARADMTTLKTFLLEEILEVRLKEVLNRIDPYVELKNRMGLLDDIVSLVEKILIKSALEKVGYVQTSAARLLGINRNTLRAKMKELKVKGEKKTEKRSRAQGVA